MALQLPSARSKLRSSSLGGIPMAFPPPGAPGARAGQQQLALAIESDAGSEPGVMSPLPGVVHIRGWLTTDEQQGLVTQFREWALPPAGLRHPRVPTGYAMSVQSVCLGWHWQPYMYSRTADDTDGAPVKPMPPAVVELARRAVVETGFAPGPRPGPSDVSSFHPDAAIVNFYSPGARLGLHQDGEEPSEAPVVTISLGDTCIFRLAGVDRRTAPFTDLRLESGDLLVFGGENRRIYHGVPKVIDGTAPGWLDLPPGRLSITVRETGLA